jgi:hypothetical protein
MLAAAVALGAQHGVATTSSPEFCRRTKRPSVKVPGPTADPPFGPLLPPDRRGPVVLARVKKLLAEANAAGGEAFTPDESAYATEMLRLHDERLAHNTLKLGIVFNLALLGLMPLLAPIQYLKHLMAANAICASVDLLWVLVLHRQRLIKAWHIVIGFNLVLIGAFSQGLSMSVPLHDDSTFVLGTSALIALSAILIILSPFSSFLTPLTAIGFWLMPVVFYPERPEAARWLAIYALALGFSCVIRHSETVRTRREAVLERRKREAELRAARVKFQRELELAREIQDSMAPPPHSITPDGMQVYCLQLKHEKVAGDWMAVRRCSDGSLVLVIADATGKGMQAALVVHAIQSLWATTLDDPSFDAKSWLERANAALFRLGEKQTHSATVGVAVLRANRLTYWSAGHLPLFLLLGNERQTMFKALLGRGNVLGLAQTLSLTPQYIDMAPNFPVRILMGSDGIFAKGTLTLHRDVEVLYSRMKKDGTTCLDGADTNDDKTLIVVERNFPAAAAPGVA